MAPFGTDVKYRFLTFDRLMPIAGSAAQWRLLGLAQQEIRIPPGVAKPGALTYLNLFVNGKQWMDSVGSV
jgi:hypothetical protein